MPRQRKGEGERNRLKVKVRIMKRERERMVNRAVVVLQSGTLGAGVGVRSIKECSVDKVGERQIKNNSLY